ncbi:MAG: Hsp33 family molecular chaperone HslO [Azoarcus sp.]|jgi:molecular chaperone Hsp33|nr:Hsp33 family molecular chaperone HslO [Azoarcus sp.]
MSYLYNMNPTSYIQRFMLENLDIKGVIVKLTDVWQAMQHDRGYHPAAAKLLGEMAAVSAVLAGNLKHPGRQVFQAQGDGPVNLLVVDCTETLNLRGFARVDRHISGRDLPSLLGEGQLQLTLKTLEMEQPYQSLIALDGNSIAEVFAHYFEQSAQQPTDLWLACNQEASVALFVQKLPSSDEKDPDGWRRIQALAETVRDDELLTLDAATLLRRLFAEEDTRLYPARAVTHHWPRDPEKIIDMLLTLGKDEVCAMLDDCDGVTIRDELSNHSYQFNVEEIEAIFQPRTLH